VETPIPDESFGIFGDFIWGDVPGLVFERSYGNAGSERVK
jgi:hypothetical protein